MEFTILRGKKLWAGDMGSGVACPYILCECRRAQLINKGDVKHKLELRADPAPRWLFLGVF